MIGAATLLAQGTSIANTQVYANTDGFAVCQVLTPGDNSKSSFAYGMIYTAGTWFQNQGGTVGSFGSGWSDVMNNNPNAMTIPIPANSSWQYYAANAGNNQADSPIQIWWFPLSSTTEGETYRTVSEEDREEPLAEPPELSTNRSDEDSGESAS
jgi:uncharacterized membrane protein